MDPSALFKISYGLFLAGVECEGVRNACIINTAQQVTAEPNRVAVCIQKDNYTAGLIMKKKSLAISILDIRTSLEFIMTFGGRSGRTVDKFEGISYSTDSLGNPYTKEAMAAYLSLTVTQTVELDTHYLFICEVLEAESLSEHRAMTYQDYRELKRDEKTVLGKGTEEGAMEGNKERDAQYVCTVCHYVYDGETPFEELPETYVCPICKKPKSVFVKE